MTSRLPKSTLSVIRIIGMGILAFAVIFAGGCPNPGFPTASTKAITSFGFQGYGVNAGIIDEALGAISVKVPVGANKTGLIAVFATTGASVTVGSAAQVSGTTVNDFTNPVTYKVTAGDGSTKYYIVTVGNPTAGQIQGIVTTLAGMPPGSADGTGSAARFDGPLSAAEYGGYLYVADYLNQIIRRIDVSTGQVTTFAGSAGVVGDADGAGSAARFSWPQGIASDGNGNLYVSDPSSKPIRKIVISTAEVTTIADSTTGIQWPQGIAVDGDYLYVADRFDHTIQRVDTRTPNTVAVFAGTSGTSGSQDGTGTGATFNQPIGITKIGGSLYVAEWGNYIIRAINITTAVVSTFAGSPGSQGNTDGTGDDARFLSPKGITSVGANLYVADSLRVRAITTPGAAVTTIAGSSMRGNSDGIGGAASFYASWGIASDAANLYVTDSDSNTVRKIEIASAQVTTLAGSPSCGTVDGTGSAALFYNPLGVVSDGTNLYVADTNNSIVRKVVISTGAVETLAGLAGAYGSTDGIGSAARFRLPQGITVHGADLYIADTSSNTIRKVVIATGEVTTVAGTPGIPGSTDGMGNVALFNGPRGITNDGVNLYVADTYNHTIRKIVISTREVTTMAGTAGAAGSTDNTGSAALFKSPGGIATDGTNLYVSDTDNYTVRMVVIATTEVTTLAGLAGTGGNTDGIGGAARFLSPRGIATDGINIYVADVDCIRSIVIATGVVATLAGGERGCMDGTGADARFNQSRGIAADCTYVYVADSENNVIRLIR